MICLKRSGFCVPFGSVSCNSRIHTLQALSALADRVLAALSCLAHRPVWSKCIFVGSSVNQHERGNSIPAQARCQYRGYAPSYAVSYQHNIAEVELLEQKMQAIGMSPDGGV